VVRQQRDSVSAQASADERFMLSSWARAFVVDGECLNVEGRSIIRSARQRRACGTTRMRLCTSFAFSTRQTVWSRVARSMDGRSKESLPGQTEVLRQITACFEDTHMTTITRSCSEDVARCKHHRPRLADAGLRLEIHRTSGPSSRWRSMIATTTRWATLHGGIYCDLADVARDMPTPPRSVKASCSRLSS